MSQSRSYSGDVGACPDRQMLSVYLDGELPSPWREKLQTHLSGCHECGQAIDSYSGAFSKGKPTGETAEIAAASERVWLRLEESRARGARTRPGGAIWRRRVSLPVPAAAAAALIALGLATALVTARPAANAASDLAVASENGFGADIGSVADYLSGQDGNGMVVLRLPESLNFVSSGELTVVRAADYTRQMTSWQGRRRN